MTKVPAALRTFFLRKNAVTRSAAKPEAIKTGQVPKPKVNISNALVVASPWLAVQNKVLYTSPHGNHPHSAPSNKAWGMLVTGSKRPAMG